jgi:hypothetical protein
MAFGRYSAGFAILIAGPGDGAHLAHMLARRHLE